MNFAENTVRYAQISAALSRSRFRSRFRLGLKDRQYICDRGWETMRRHAAELVAERLPPLSRMTANRRPCAAIRSLSRSTRLPAAVAAVWKNGIRSPPGAR